MSLERLRQDPEQIEVRVTDTHGLSHPQLYAWGLEMYHPKWFPNPAKSARLARLAVAAARRSGGRWAPMYRERVALRLALLGYRQEAGHISLQGHDPTTDLRFRNFRIGVLK